MSYWIKCWIGLIESKSSRKRKSRVALKKKKKQWSQANFSSSVFRLIQHKFHVGSVYCSIPRFVLTTSFRMLELRIGNDSTKLKRTLHVSRTSNGNELEHQWRRFWPPIEIAGTTWGGIWSAAEEVEYSGKRRQSKPKKVYKGNWKRERFRKLGKMGMTKKIRTITKQWISCPSPSLIWHRMKEWKDLHIEWKKLDSTYKRYKLSPNILPRFIQHYIQHVG